MSKVLNDMLGGGVLAPGILVSELTFPDHLEIAGDSSLFGKRKAVLPVG